MTAIKKTKSIRKDKNSSPASFLERPLPESEEVLLFEQAIKKEVLSQEADQNLSAIYRDSKGNLVDVSKVKKRRRLRLIVLFKQLLIITILACGLYGAYYYYFQRPAGTEGVSLRVTAPEKISVGTAFSYELIYENNSGLALANVSLEAILPSTFVLATSSPETSGLNSWFLGNLNPGASGKVIISGYLVAAVDAPNVIGAKLNYTPANFSSEFKKEASANTVISGLGFAVNTDYLNTALIGQNNELRLDFSSFKENQIQDLYLAIRVSDNFKIESVGSKEQLATSTPISSEEITTVSVRPAGEGNWTIHNLPLNSEQRISVPMMFSLKEKKQDKEDFTLRLLKREPDGSERIFWEKTISFDVMKSDLNLSLSLNGEKSDQPIDFGETLEYSLTYSNNGDSALYDLVLMVVIKGDFVQWSSLRDPSGGSRSGNAIVWTKEQIPTLAELTPGSNGTIDFAVKVKSFTDSDLGRDAFISSYAQYGINNQTSNEGDDNKSNTINSQLNSDLALSEKILYFNEDNQPIGSGPLPPRVGETTTVRVAWTIKNNLHDLEEAQVVLDLPVGVSWAAGNNTNVGKISYDEESRRITWRIGFLPLSVYRADAEFNLSLTPSEADRNKILVISPGSLATAIDAVTKGELQRKTQAKTSKLEDDEIAGLSSSGRVE